MKVDRSMLNLSVLLEFAGRGGSRPLERNSCAFGLIRRASSK
ncbi:hypothetical protein QCO44_05545 [Selenomonas sputigena]|uniref:Uncharacterized protein n=1 Tax=Selenomonas sputigena TaxID=69823 RepID=A0ABV3X669_9FIRM